jgi:hypothetical protein
MSPSYTSAVVAILATLLPRVGVEIGSEELTSLISAIVVVVSGLVIIYRRYMKGDITLLGGKKA